MLNVSEICFRCCLVKTELLLDKEVEIERLLIEDEEMVPFEENSLDVILSGLSLHWINDLPGRYKTTSRRMSHIF
jgi:hypothetical protein